MLYVASDQQLLLAAQPPSRLQRRVAYWVMAGLLALFCLLAPYARIPLQPVQAFVPSYATLFVFSELVIAALILAQFWAMRWTWLLVLAGAFLFAGLMGISGALAFPGVFSPSGLLGAGPQSAAWIGAIYHVTTPASLIVAVLIKDCRQTTGLVQRAPAKVMALSLAGVVAVACGLSWLALAHSESLPQIFADSVRQSRSFVLVAGPIMVLEAVALLLLWRRGDSVLELWLMVVCCAWLMELSLGAIFAGSRYTLGWYSARTFQLGATIIVLVLLLSETTALYARMVRETIRRRGARHAQQIAMDAMAASIGHEIKQPLTAIMANAGAGKTLARRQQPDLREMHAIFSDIAEDGERIGEIIRGIRVMFQKSTHERKLLDINRVVRDVLAGVELDLLIQRVSVKTELEEDLPQVLGNGGQLQQLFLNLITNAVEAMHSVAGRPSVLTVRSRSLANSETIEVAVEDSGVGIEGVDKDQLFEAFFSTKPVGTGIGLTICRVIVEAHGGKLEVSANQPYGTIFRVILPAGGEG